MYAPDLPPLNALVAFEASARLLSFTAAADELDVTQGAISRQVKLLEDNLGQPLIVRSRPRLSLTPTGVQYLNKITPCLHMIADATSLARSDQTEQLTIVTTSAMASFWLLPRFTGFQKKHPQQVKIIKTTRNLGKGNAVFWGMSKALENKDFDTLAFLDADLSASPED